MKIRTIGSLEVSAIGLGCMNISAGYGPADDEHSAAMLLSAIDHGYTFFDTATLYGFGHSEIILGRTLNAVRQNIVLASKCGLDKKGINGRPANLRVQCHESLRKLQTDTIDLYYLHRVDPDVPIAESVGAMADLVKEGKIREIGLSEVCTSNLMMALDEHPIAALQSEYSLWSRTPEFGILDACKENNVTMVPFSPLARGFLAGGAKDVSELADNDLRCTIARPRFETGNFEHNSKLLVPFQAIAEQHNCTMAQLGLAWLLAVHDKNMIPIPGTRLQAHMIENAGADRIDLDEQTIKELDELINESTIQGNRYTDARMAEADSERDKPQNPTQDQSKN